MILLVAFWAWPSGDIDIADDAAHTLADGRRLLIMHGSHLDGVRQYCRRLSALGEALYHFAMSQHYRLSRLHVRLRGGEPVALGCATATH